MIQPLAPTTCTRRREGAPVRDGYRLRTGTVTESEVVIYGPMPAPAKVRAGMPDGFRSRQTVYTLSYDTDWQGSYDGEEADQLTFGGVTYRLVEVTSCPAFLSQPPHVVLLGVREQPRQMPEPT